MINSVPFLTVITLESKDTKCESSLPPTISFISVFSGITKGLALRLWGAIGVNTKTYGTIVVPDASVFNNDGNSDGSMFICSGGSGIQAGLAVVDGDIIVRIGGVYRLQLQHIT